MHSARQNNSAAGFGAQRERNNQHTAHGWAMGVVDISYGAVVLGSAGHNKFAARVVGYDLRISNSISIQRVRAQTI